MLCGKDDLDISVVPARLLIHLLIGLDREHIDGT